MFVVPDVAQPLVQSIAPCFTHPTLRRFVLLMCATITSLGRHTVSHMLYSVRGMVGGHWSSFHRVFSDAVWSPWPLARLLAQRVVALLPPEVPLLVAADDTVERRNGDHVWGASVHRDPLVSTRTLARFRRGHKWVVLAIVLKLPFTTRLWALPLLVCLVSGKATDQANGRRHHTVRQRVRQMLIRLMRWFPDRQIILVGDWGVSCHELAEFASQHADRLTVIARMRADTCLHDPPAKPRRCRNGKWAVKGKRQATPEKQAEALTSRQVQVQWYGRGERPLQCVSGTGLWYNKHRNAVVPIRWVRTVNPDTGNQDYFYCTDQQMPVQQIIQHFIGRWPIEVTFEEMRANLGLQHTRHWCEKSVLRVAPCQFGLFTVVSLWYAELSKHQEPRLLHTPCYQKDHVTFADALAAVRREIWQATLLAHVPQGQCLNHLPADLQEWLLDHLSAAA